MASYSIVALGPGFAAAVLAALLTYALHGLIWGGIVALVARSRAFSPSMQSYLWLAALLGPVLTTAVASWLVASTPLKVELGPLADGPSVAAAATIPDAVLLGLLIAAAALGGLRFAASVLALQQRLRDRARVDDPRLIARLNSLRSRTSLGQVTLTKSATIDVPLVLGRSEVCLPADSLSVASDAEIDAVLAHELAHLVRGDGVVFPLVGLVQSLGWLQPLNHWVAARFKQAAELACDDCAVELTGDRQALARALVRAAESALGSPRDSMLPAIARPHARSASVMRVRRLVGKQERTCVPRHAGWAAVCCSVLAVGAVSVSVRAARTGAPRLDATPPTATEQISGLMESAEQVEREIVRLQGTAAESSSASEVRLLELQQQLRHVRETVAWIERRSSGQVRP